jgi:hypothetical protein
MTALSQTVTPQTVISQQSLRDRLLVAGITFVAPAALISAVCVAFTHIS